MFFPLSDVRASALSDGSYPCISYHRSALRTSAESCPHVFCNYVLYILQSFSLFIQGASFALSAVPFSALHNHRFRQIIVQKPSLFYRFFPSVLHLFVTGSVDDNFPIIIDYKSLSTFSTWFSTGGFSLQYKAFSNFFRKNRKPAIQKRRFFTGLVFVDITA